MIAINEADQHEVIAALARTGYDDIVNRLARCQRDRQHRYSGWPRVQIGGLLGMPPNFGEQVLAGL